MMTAAPFYSTSTRCELEVGLGVSVTGDYLFFGIRVSVTGDQLLVSGRLVGAAAD